MEALRRRVAAAAEGEGDRRVRLWMRVVPGGERPADPGRELGYRDGSGVRRVVLRLEAAAREDRELGATLRRLRAALEDQAPCALS
jgi:hypothetical protein